MSPSRPKCWLIGSGKDSPRAAARVARLRGLEICTCDVDAIRALLPGRDQLIAISFDLLARLDSGSAEALRKCVESGATIYVRGDLQTERVYSLRPFSAQMFELSTRPADGYQFSTHPILPSAIAGERVTVEIGMPRAIGLERDAQAIVSSLNKFEAARPSIFSIDVGAGLAIFDLHPDNPVEDLDLLSDLASPERLAANAGALAAADWVAGRNPAIAAPVNLVIDDRPTNYDYFNAGKLNAFLQHLERECPGVHTDFAWTPSHTRPHRGYLDVLRRYKTGFVWHGYLNHVDHRKIGDYEAHLSQGRALVQDISREYRVRFQPVMIFPFEKDTPRAEDLLRQSGFVAKVQSTEGSPPQTYYRQRDADDENSPFSVVFRDSIELLSRERMLALATLGMPIVALAHPKDLSLRRFGRFSPEAISYFDPVLRFAAEKSLRPMSLEKVAAEVPAKT